MKLVPESVRWRLTLWYSIALATMLGVFAIGSLGVLRVVLLDRTERFLEAACESFVTELGFEHAATATIPDAVRAALRDIRFSDVRFVVFDASGRPVLPLDDPASLGPHAGSSPAPSAMLQRLATAIAGTDSTPATVTLPDTDADYHAALRRTALGGAMHTVAAVQSLRALGDTLRGVAAAYVVAIPLLLAGAVVGGYGLAKRALSPVAEMSRHARAIGATNLHERLPVRNARDELGDLAAMVNDLLARIESSFEQRRQFFADASHELRTPTAIVRAESEVALARDTRPEAEYREALRVIQEAGERLSRIVDDLFLLARADSGQYVLRRDPLYVDELAADAIRAVRAVAAQRSVTIEQHLVAEAAYTGDAELLQRMLFNLLDNAIKHSPPGTAVTVRLDRIAGAYQLGVSDAGPGIPADSQARIFDRFYRANVTGPLTGGRNGGGAGLGLAIARWVASVHSGTLELVRSTPAGSEFRVTLPDGPNRESLVASTRRR
jgi:signal transduction histidine kinase